MILFGLRLDITQFQNCTLSEQVDKPIAEIEVLKQANVIKINMPVKVNSKELEDHWNTDIEKNIKDNVDSYD